MEEEEVVEEEEQEEVTDTESESSNGVEVRKRTRARVYGTHALASNFKSKPLASHLRSGPPTPTETAARDSNTDLQDEVPHT